MTVEIKLKEKYVGLKATGRYRSSHNDGQRRVKRTGHRPGVSDQYIAADHVLVLVEGRKRTWQHKKVDHAQ